MEEFCTICAAAVSRKPEKAHQRVVLPNGEVVHRFCESQSLQMKQLATEWAAPVRGARAASEMAMEQGHATRIERDSGGFYWVCSCGMRDSAGDRVTRNDQKDGALKHKRWVAVQVR